MDVPQHSRAPSPVQRLTFTVDETATAAGVSRTTIYKLLMSGELRSVRLGTRRVIPCVEVYRLLGTSGTS